MKKAILIIWSILFFGMISVRAADNDISLSMYVKEKYQSGKAFNLYLSLNCQTEIGISRFSVSYNPDLLTLKNVSLEETTATNTLSYNDNNGQTDIIYIPQSHQNIILRFQPVSLQANSYDFEAFIYEACDNDGNYIPSDTTYQLSLSISDDKEVVQTQTITNHQGTVESQSTSEQSKKTDKSESSPNANTSSSAEESNEETSETTESSQATIYRVIHEDKHTDQTQFFIFAGGVILLAVCLILVYKSGFKNGKETEKKKE